MGRTLVRRVLTVGVCAALAALLWTPRTTAEPSFPPTADEVRFGAQIAKEIESRYRLVTDPAQVGRITRIGETVVRGVERQDLTYRFKIVQIAGVNALSIPGGWVYVTAGMMRFVRTDDELAAVLAHELTHINHRHYYVQQQRSSSMTVGMILAAALSVLAKSAAPLIAAQAGTQAALATYQRDLERDADLTGIGYLMKTSYTPVAMLTLMEHLAQADRFSGHPDESSFEDHPKPDERVVYIREDLARRHIPIVRRVAEGYLKILVDPSPASSGPPVTVRVDGQPILTVGVTADGRTHAERAAALAARLDAFFNLDPAPYDVRTVMLLDRWRVIGGETVLFEVTPQDAAFAGTTAGELAADVRARLARVIAAAPYNRKF